MVANGIAPHIFLSQQLGMLFCDRGRVGGIKHRKLEALNLPAFLI